jgi:hypothetical protein
MSASPPAACSSLCCSSPTTNHRSSNVCLRFYTCSCSICSSAAHNAGSYACGTALALPAAVSNLVILPDESLPGCAIIKCSNSAAAAAGACTLCGLLLLLLLV